MINFSAEEYIVSTGHQVFLVPTEKIQLECEFDESPHQHPHYIFSAVTRSTCVQ